MLYRAGDQALVVTREDGKELGLFVKVYTLRTDGEMVNKAHGVNVKQLVDRREIENRPEALKRSYRSWGYYQSVDSGARYQVKRIVVKPGERLSLQKHFHRAERWFVVKGTAEVTRDDEVHLVHENESIYLPIGCVHRMANPGRIDLELIEVQTEEFEQAASLLPHLVPVADARALAALWDKAVESLGRSASELQEVAESTGEVIARIAARGDRIDRIQNETRTLLNALVASEANA